jgi:hypothetical protein
VRVLAVVIVALAFSPPVGASSFVLRATADVQRFGDFNITASPTLGGLKKVFGPWDDCTMRAWFSMAVWRSLGFRVRLTSLGGTPPPQFCTDPKVFIDSVVVTGKRWHTAKGLRVGDTAAKFRRLYPSAHRHRNGWGLVEVYERCVIGICPGAYWWKPQLTAVFSNGRVTSFVFPVGAQGE